TTISKSWSTCFRRAAMERARSRSPPTCTGKTKLTKGRSDDIQFPAVLPGILTKQAVAPGVSLRLRRPENALGIKWRETREPILLVRDEPDRHPVHLRPDRNLHVGHVACRKRVRDMD